MGTRDEIEWKAKWTIRRFKGQKKGEIINFGRDDYRLSASLLLEEEMGPDWAHSGREKTSTFGLSIRQRILMYMAAGGAALSIDHNWGLGDRILIHSDGLEQPRTKDARASVRTFTIHSGLPLHSNIQQKMSGAKTPQETGKDRDRKRGREGRNPPGGKGASKKPRTSPPPRGGISAHQPAGARTT